MIISLQFYAIFLYFPLLISIGKIPDLGGMRMRLVLPL